jgi:TetR/AcrR family transcriptional regulator, regulator of cefoperazone and chloramphenicol sensitivity
MNGSTGDRETRDRLFKAAERLFSARGFKNVTVREICHDAGANVAAINYHFGDKLGLYRVVLKTAIDAMRDSTEEAKRAGAGKPPEEQLRTYVALFLRRLLQAKNEAVHRLIEREVSDPTPALDDLLDQGIRPRIEYLSEVIAAMIGCDPSDERVFRCVVSVQAQTIIYARPNVVAERLGFPVKPSPEMIDEAARHIADFSVAGVYAIGRAHRTAAAHRG